MVHEVVVVGGGIGGLTVAALLAARGVDVCLLERQPQIGGCVANFEKFGYNFEPGMGLYSCWDPGDVHQRIFSELPVEPPDTIPLDPVYVSRLSDDSEIVLVRDSELFEKKLIASFPECGAAAISFYGQVTTVGEALSQALRRVPDLPTAGQSRQIYAFLPKIARASQFAVLKGRGLRDELDGTSPRFQEFVELQLRVFTDIALAECAYLPACALLHSARKNLFAIRGGGAALAERLAESIRTSGGKVRLDSPVLRLSYDSTGQATGVDLLSGENISWSRAIVSNMTVWDTYGKLIGLQRTPADLKKRLATLRSSGAYLIHCGMDQEAAKGLPAEHFLVANKQAATETLIDTSRFGFACSSDRDARAPAGKRAVTICFSSDVEQWFTYQADAEEQNLKDQAALETGWQVLHSRMPELGNNIEVIDTATPSTYYENTRRKLGMVWGLGLSLSFLGEPSLSHRTTLPNVFMVGDSAFPGAGLAAVSQSALVVANEIVRR